MLASLTGQRSAADLDETSRLKVISFFAGELARLNPEPDPTTTAPIAILPAEIVEEALDILGMAA